MCGGIKSIGWRLRGRGAHGGSMRGWRAGSYINVRQAQQRRYARACGNTSYRTRLAAELACWLRRLAHRRPQRTMAYASRQTAFLAAKRHRATAAISAKTSAGNGVMKSGEENENQEGRRNYCQARYAWRGIAGGNKT
jgi:hypothetical protein